MPSEDVQALASGCVPDQIATAPQRGPYFSASESLDTSSSTGRPAATSGLLSAPGTCWTNRADARDGTGPDEGGTPAGGTPPGQSLLAARSPARPSPSLPPSLHPGPQRHPRPPPHHAGPWPSGHPTTPHVLPVPPAAGTKPRP